MTWAVMHMRRGSEMMGELGPVIDTDVPCHAAMSLPRLAR